MGFTLVAFLTLISKLRLKLDSLVLQVVERVLILAIRRAYLILKVPQLQVHLGPRLKRRRTPSPTAIITPFAQWRIPPLNHRTTECILLKLGLSLSKILLLRGMVSFLSVRHFLLLILNQCLGMGGVELAPFRGHCHRVHINVLLVKSVIGRWGKFG